MESRDKVRAQLRTAERAAAAPFIDYPAKGYWWVSPGFGVLASLFVVGVNLNNRSDAPGAVGALLLAIVGLSGFGFVLWQRRLRGTLPAGKAPREINRVMWGFIVGAVTAAVALFMLADWAPLQLGVPVAFVLATAGMCWYGYAYGRAAAKVRERLA